MEKNYSEWVKEASITSLLDALIELHDDEISARADYSIYEESGKETERNYLLVYNEIIKRTNK